MNEKRNSLSRLFGVVGVGSFFSAVAFVAAAYSTVPLSNTALIGMLVINMAFVVVLLILSIIRSRRGRQTGDGEHATKLR